MARCGGAFLRFPPRVTSAFGIVASEMIASTTADRRIGALSAHVSVTDHAERISSQPTAGTATRPSRLKIAAVVTEYRRYSHAQHICDRFLIGYGWGNRHHKPACDLVALYVHQHDESTHLAEQVRHSLYCGRTLPCSHFPYKR